LRQAIGSGTLSDVRARLLLIASLGLLAACHGGPTPGKPGGPTGTIRFVANGTIREIDLATRKVADVRPGRDPASASTGEDVWVSDEKKICGTTAEDRCIMVAGTDGRGVISLKSCKGCELASISPDGNFLAYAGYCREKVCGASSHATFVRDRHGKLLHVFPSLGAPTWTPKNELVLAGDSLQGKVGLYLAVDHVHEVRVDTDLADPKELSVSPDGKRVAFKMSGGDGQAYVVPLAGGEPPKKLTDLKDRTIGWPTFSPDGKWIVFENKERSWQDGVLTIVSADGGGMTPLVDDARKPVAGGGRLQWR